MLKHLFITTLIFGSTVSLSAQYQAKELTARDTITDKDLVVPEEIERNYDELLSNWRKEYKPSQDCSSNYDTDVTYPDSIYIHRLYSLPTVMELAYNPVVRSYIDMYTGRMRNSVSYFLGKSNYYFPIFEQALDKAGLPLELKYLPIIESALNPTIASRVGATGLWQFMIGTGRMYGLEINSLVDERRDPLRSTDAAVRYLKDLYEIYKDWNLVIAAYNCGPGNVNRAIRLSGGQTDYWAIYPYLPRETRGYVPAFIAATYVMNYPQEHNICPVEYNYNVSTDTIVVDKQLHLQQLSDVLSLSIDEIREMNPQFKNDIVPGEYKPYSLTLPSALAVDFAQYKDSVYAYHASELLLHRKVVEPTGGVTTKIRHKVKRGETLASIAIRNGVTAKQIRKWNHMKSNKVRVGQMLTIHKTVVSKPAKTEQTYFAENQGNGSSSEDAASQQETSSPGSSGGILAQYFNRRSAQAAQSTEPVQPTDSTELDVDSQVDSTEESHMPEEQRTIYHKVRIGETLALIASKYNIDKDNIAKWNKLKSAIPKVGQRLVLHLPATPPQTEEKDEALEDENESLPEELAAIDSTNNSKPEAKVEQVIAQEVQKEQQPVVNKKKAKTTAKASTTSTYVVRQGDTLGGIAAKFGKNVTSSKIMKANNLKSDKLKIGQKLQIPR